MTIDIDGLAQVISNRVTITTPLRYAIDMFVDSSLHSPDIIFLASISKEELKRSSTYGNPLCIP